MSNEEQRGAGVSEQKQNTADSSPGGGDAARSPLAARHSPLATESWSVGRLLDWTAKFLAEKGSESPRLDAEVLLAHSLGCRRIDLYTRYEEPASPEARDRFRALVRQRLERCPVAYLVGRKEFFGLEFEVGPSVLIPRPESEFVVMECLRLAKGMEQPRVLDLGTGSGNIVVAVAKKHPGVQATAVDVSGQALATARRNAERHGVAERIRFLEGDLFGPVPAGERFDLVLSNPPYIARETLGDLPPGVRDFEPRLALDGGPGGYAVLDRILDGAAGYLEPGGYVILEIGAPQAEPVRERVAKLPRFRLEETIHDFSGHPRVLRIRHLGAG